MTIQWMNNGNIAYLALAAGMLLGWRIWLALRRSRDRRNRAFQRKLETVLLPRETVKAVCPQGRQRYILTNKRLLAETRKGFASLDLKDIKSAQGATAEGRRTTVPEKMAVLTIKAPTELTLKHTGAEFEALARELSAQLKKRREKKK